MFEDFVADRMTRPDVAQRDGMRRLLRKQAGALDRVIGAVSEAYEHELARPRSAEDRRAELVRGLLAGELLELSELSYDFTRWHLGIVAAGERAEQAVREAAASSDVRLLTVSPEPRCVWGWAGASEKSGLCTFERTAARRSDTPVGIGEPTAGVDAGA